MQKPSHALGAGPAAPERIQKDETPNCQAGGSWDHSKEQREFECAVAQEADQVACELGRSDGIRPAKGAHSAEFHKALATLSARLALFGLELHRQDDGTLLVKRAGLARRFTSIAAAASFVDGLGVRHE